MQGHINYLLLPGTYDDWYCYTQNPVIGKRELSHRTKNLLEVYLKSLQSNQNTAVIISSVITVLLFIV